MRSDLLYGRNACVGNITKSDNDIISAIGWYHLLRIPCRDERGANQRASLLTVCQRHSDSPEATPPWTPRSPHCSKNCREDPIGGPSHRQLYCKGKKKKKEVSAPVRSDPVCCWAHQVESKTTRLSSTILHSIFSLFLQRRPVDIYSSFFFLPHLENRIRIRVPNTGDMASSTFPPPAVNTIDWSNVGFRVREGV